MCVILAFTCIPFVAKADEVAYSGTTGECTWEFDNKTGTLTISGNGEMYNYGFVYKYSGPNNCMISTNVPWANYQDNIKSVKIQNGVKNIGDLAFFACNYLQDIDISESVSRIGSYSLNGCRNLKNLKLTKNITYIGVDSFSECISLKEIEIDSDNEQFKAIDGNLYNKKGTQLIQYALGNERESFTVKGEVEIIESQALTYCKNLKTIEVEKDNKEYSSESGVLYSKDGLVLLQYPLAKSEADFCLPEKVETIGSWSFAGSKVENIFFNSALKYFSYDAFVECDRLKNIYYNGTNHEWEKVTGEKDQLKNAKMHYTKTVDLKTCKVLSISTTTYTGKTITPNIRIKDREFKLIHDVDYSLSYKNNKNVGKATVIVTGTGCYTGSVTQTFTITKASNPVKVMAKSTVTADSKKKTTIKKAVTVTKAQGKVTYTTNNKKVTVKNGTMTVAKGLKKGKTVSVKVTVTAKGNSNYKSKKIVKTIKIKVK